MCENGTRQLPLFVDPGEERRGYVYVLISHMRTAFKIGFTSRAPHRRGGELRKDGQMLCWWPGDRHDEQRLHDQLEARRLVGNQEWYDIRPDTLRFLIGKCQEGNFPQALKLLRNLTARHETRAA